MILLLIFKDSWENPGMAVSFSPHHLFGFFSVKEQEVFINFLGWLVSICLSGWLPYEKDKPSVAFCVSRAKYSRSCPIASNRMSC